MAKNPISRSLGASGVARDGWHWLCTLPNLLRRKLVLASAQRIVTEMSGR